MAKRSRERLHWGIREENREDQEIGEESLDGKEMKGRRKGYKRRREIN